MTLTTHPTPTAESADAAWPVLPALSASASQQVFRACLGALSRPGSLQRLPADELPAGVPAAALVPLALTDLMAPLAGLGRAAGLARRIATATGAQYVEPEQARFAVALDDDHEELSGLPVGSTWSPEFGALLSQRVEALRQAQGAALRQAQGAEAIELTLSGPGIKGTTMITVAGLSRDFFAARADLTAAFPTGIDLVLITDYRTMIGIPRTTRIEVG
ncbi:phosphonate C-P lyase system protein PhnH [Microlunatus parietis]|uniref:Alpha-D-ribose 1-methylphosphonate 5-triphosphate synthase subunit PhnH n=1 Tax=Microlunatus parietis TaxID=682979 RepID=A0A7Y9LAH2_9ACTN|nr:phosphonate C-P lyase system protein PhnH [Microlunatus parietis]NYE69793.1 alpha-D-ribose 1-methylphosphonate 5-triphosphate synthase subunit PhnH [Microlunatus parietis]